VRRASTISVLSLVLAGCAGASPVASPTASDAAPDPTASASTAPSQPSIVDLAPGPLEPGVTYLLPDLEGLAVRMEEDGWLATLPNGGDVTITGGRTVVYLLRPNTVIAPDQAAQIPWPTEVAEAKAALESARGVSIASAEPITVAGIETELLLMSVRNASEAAPLLTTGSGEFGLEDGDFAVLLPIGDRVIVVGLDSDGNTDRALAEGSVLLESLVFSE
jgi:hypothetical protein